MTLATCTILGAVGTREAGAANLEKLLMPGEVSAAHAKIEEECSSCHDRSDRSRQTALCLDCHRDVAADVTRRAGLHGRLPNLTQGECKACHSEHLGRKADIVRLVPGAFDHRLTDFPLEGGHATTACASCHAPGRKHRDAPSTCGSCHQSVDVHRGSLGKDCGACHNVSTWFGARFDHARTRFPLRGEHARITCASCHAAGQFKGAPLTCVACHAPDDVHVGSRGSDCASCHTESRWTTARFDHARETGFALLGRHASLDCAGCHRSGRFEDELPRECAGCHRSADAHSGRFGTDCDSCHGHDAWAPTPFDHAVRAQVALRGAHEKLDCHACHTGKVGQQKFATGCAGCHRGDDVHAGALGTDCASCHDEQDWRARTLFDHDLGDFPLLGMHVLVGCGQCHTSQAFQDTPQECVACHRSQDVHRGALGTDCAACHSPNGWKLWEFDHATQTDFPLTGAHGKLGCGACHRNPAGVVRLPTDCAACHRESDIHLGQFGAQCQRCHTTLTFKGARIQ